MISAFIRNKDKAINYINNLKSLCDKVERLLFNKNFIYNCELELKFSEKIKKIKFIIYSFIERENEFIEKS